MQGVMRVGARRVLIGVSVAALLLVGAGQPASAAVRGSVAFTVPGDLAAGTGSVVAKVTRLNHRGPITVEFGREGAVQVAVQCSPRRSNRVPLQCAGSAQHVFATPGRHFIRVKAGSKVIAERAVEVDYAPVTGPWREQMLALANEVRAKAGRAPLRLCPTLNIAAQAHADDMLARGYYEHDTPEGLKAWDRGASAGYGTNVWYAENIHALVRTVEEAMEGWVNSPGHYANLINPELTDAGFGYAVNAERETRWVQNFGGGGTCG